MSIDFNNFWSLSDGEDAAISKSTAYEIPGGGNLEPIPDRSSVLAMIDEAKWDQRDGARYISLRWTVIQPDAFKNRKIFQKLWVMDDDPGAKNPAKAAKKRDKARRMLAAIDANAGGRLTSVPGAPTDGTLAQHLTNKPMVIKVMIWEVDDRQTGERIRGNWIAAIAPKTHPTQIADAKLVAKPERIVVTAGDIDIPF